MIYPFFAAKEEEEEDRRRIKDRKSGSPKLWASWRVRCVAVQSMANRWQGGDQVVHFHVTGDGAEDGGLPCTVIAVVGRTLL
jgi:hypothetical protein